MTITPKIPSFTKDFGFKEGADEENNYPGVALVFREVAHATVAGERILRVITRFNELSDCQFDNTLYPNASCKFYYRDHVAPPEEDIAQYFKETLEYGKNAYVWSCDTKNERQMQALRDFSGWLGVHISQWQCINDMAMPKYQAGTNTQVAKMNEAYLEAFHAAEAKEKEELTVNEKHIQISDN